MKKSNAPLPAMAMAVSIADMSKQACCGISDAICPAGRSCHPGHVCRSPLCLRRRTNFVALGRSSVLQGPSPLLLVVKVNFRAVCPWSLPVRSVTGGSP